MCAPARYKMYLHFCSDFRIFRPCRSLWYDVYNTIDAVLLVSFLSSKTYRRTGGMKTACRLELGRVRVFLMNSNISFSGAENDDLDTLSTVKAFFETMGLK